MHDEPWWAFNYYLGDLRSRVVVNSDQQTTAADLVTLAAHEAYPGHHTERVVKEQLLVRDQGFLEESIQLVPTPQSLVGEGIAELGLEVVMDDELERELDATLTAHGLEGDLARAFAIGRARQPIRGIGLDVALMIHEHGLSTEEARAHYERWAMAHARAVGERRALRDRPDLARVRGHLLRRRGSLQRLRRRRSGALPHAAHRAGSGRRPARRAARRSR